MMLDQNELDALLAGGNLDQTDGDAPPPTPTPAPASTPAAELVGGNIDIEKLPANVKRLMRLRVPVIVQLAQHRITVGQARRLSLGLILEFSKAVHDDLALLINNRPIAAGEAVKVGEKFGLRLSTIRSRAARIRALGK